jgi:hypothetical protein
VLTVVAGPRFLFDVSILFPNTAAAIFSAVA